MITPGIGSQEKIKKIKFVKAVYLTHHDGSFGTNKVTTWSPSCIHRSKGTHYSIVIVN